MMDTNKKIATGMLAGIFLSAAALCVYGSARVAVNAVTGKSDLQDRDTALLKRERDVAVTGLYSTFAAIFGAAALTLWRRAQREEKKDIDIPITVDTSALKTDPPVNAIIQKPGAPRVWN